MIVLDSQLDLYKHYTTDCIFECMFLATLPGHERQSIGRRMTQYSYELAKTIGRDEHLELLSNAVRSCGKRPKVISAIFTSAFSQKIGRQLKFEELAEVQYDDLYFHGIPFSQRIANKMHNSAVVMAKKL